MYVHTGIHVCEQSHVAGMQSGRTETIIPIQLTVVVFTTSAMWTGCQTCVNNKDILIIIIKQFKVCLKDGTSHIAVSESTSCFCWRYVPCIRFLPPTTTYKLTREALFTSVMDRSSCCHLVSEAAYKAPPLSLNTGPEDACLWFATSQFPRIHDVYGRQKHSKAAIMIDFIFELHLLRAQGFSAPETGWTCSQPPFQKTQTQPRKLRLDETQIQLRFRFTSYRAFLGSGTSWQLLENCSGTLHVHSIPMEFVCSMGVIQNKKFP